MGVSLERPRPAVPGACPLPSSPPRAGSRRSPGCSPGARTPQPPVNKALAPSEARATAAPGIFQKLLAPERSTLRAWAHGDRVHSLPGTPTATPPFSHATPTAPQSCGRDSVPALSSRLAPSLPALLLAAPPAGPGPYLTTAAKDDDDEAAGAASGGGGGGGGAGVLGWPGGAAGVQDGDDDEAAAAAGARPEAAG